MANVGDVRTRAQLFTTGLLEGSLPGILRYRGRVIGDASPAAAEVFLDAQENSRIYIPDSSVISVQLVGSAWNVTDGSAPTSAFIFGVFKRQSDTVSIAPTNLRAADGNPITEYVGETGGAFALSVDDTNKAIRVLFTATANDTYEVAATVIYSFAAAELKGPNFFSVTN